MVSISVNRISSSYLGSYNTWKNLFVDLSKEILKFKFWWDVGCIPFYMPTSQRNGIFYYFFFPRKRRISCFTLPSVMWRNTDDIWSWDLGNAVQKAEPLKTAKWSCASPPCGSQGRWEYIQQSKRLRIIVLSTACGRSPAKSPWVTKSCRRSNVHGEMFLRGFGRARRLEGYCSSHILIFSMSLDTWKWRSSSNVPLQISVSYRNEIYWSVAHQAVRSVGTETPASQN